MDTITPYDPERIYFSTCHHLYVLAYERAASQLAASSTGLSPFVTPLIALPFIGNSWRLVADDLLSLRATLVQVPFRYLDDRLGAPTLLPDPLQAPHAPPFPVKNILVLRPSHVTAELAALIEREGSVWYTTAMSQWTDERGDLRWVRKNIQYAQEEQPFYDLFAHGDHPSDEFPPLVRKHYDHLHTMAEAIVSSKGGILLQYDEQEDTLTWLNPRYTSADQPILGLDEMIRGDGWE